MYNPTTLQPYNRGVGFWAVQPYNPTTAGWDFGLYNPTTLPVAPGHAERGTAKDAKRLQCVERRGRKRMYVHELVVLKMKDD